jgi:hypothetical protein
VKIERMREQYRKLKEGVEKLKADNAKALGYSTGMTGPDEDTAQRLPPLRKTRNPCKHCGSMSHSRITSKKCPHHPSNANRNKEAVGSTVSTVGNDANANPTEPRVQLTCRPVGCAAVSFPLTTVRSRVNPNTVREAVASQWNAVGCEDTIGNTIENATTVGSPWTAVEDGRNPNHNEEAVGSTTSVANANPNETAVESTLTPVLVPGKYRRDLIVCECATRPT